MATYLTSLHFSKTPTNSDIMPTKTFTWTDIILACNNETKSTFTKPQGGCWGAKCRLYDSRIDADNWSSAVVGVCKNKLTNLHLKLT